MGWFKDLFISSELQKKLAEVDRRIVELDEPKASELKDHDGKLSITGWNFAYIKDLRSRLPTELTTTKTDSEVVQLWVDRYNYEHVEPRLEVIHAGIDKDGRIKMKLDWNDAFIRLLQERDIPGDTEEKMIENYLAMMTRKVDADVFDEDEGEPAAKRLPEEHEIERELENMNPEVVRRMERVIRSRAAKRPGLHRDELKAARKRTLDN